MLPLRSQKGNATQVDLFEAEKKEEDWQNWLSLTNRAKAYFIWWWCHAWRAPKELKDTGRTGGDGLVFPDWKVDFNHFFLEWLIFQNTDIFVQTTLLGMMNDTSFFASHPDVLIFFFFLSCRTCKVFFLHSNTTNISLLWRGTGEQKHTLNHKYGLIHTAYTQRIQQKAYQSLECCYKPTED